MLAVLAVLALMGFTVYALDRIRNEQRLPPTQSSSRIAQANCTDPPIWTQK
jgi:hypothetical protein